jgi:hypothetical protein
MIPSDAVVRSQAELDALLRVGDYGPSDAVTIDAAPKPELRVPPLRHPMPRTYRLFGRSVVVALAEKGEGNGGSFDVYGSAVLEGVGCRHVTVGSAGRVDVADASIEARDRAQVRCQRSRVTARDYASVEAADARGAIPNFASRVEAVNHATVILRGSSRGQPGELVQLTAYDDALVEKGSVQMRGVIRLYDHARCVWREGFDDRFTIEAHDETYVELGLTPGLGEVTIVARGRAKVIVRGGSALVTLQDDATADVGTGCRVEARGRSKVTGRGAARIKRYDAATVDAMSFDVQVHEGGSLADARSPAR